MRPCAVSGFLYILGAERIRESQIGEKPYLLIRSGVKDRYRLFLLRLFPAKQPFGYPLYFQFGQQCYRDFLHNRKIALVDNYLGLVLQDLSSPRHAKIVPNSDKLLFDNAAKLGGRFQYRLQFDDKLFDILVFALNAQHFQIGQPLQPKI